MLILETIAQTKPLETAEREALYHQYQAFDLILGTMHGYMNASQAILTEQESEALD